MKRPFLALFVAWILILATWATPILHAQLQQTPPPWAIQVKQGDSIVFNVTGNVQSTTYWVCYSLLTLQGDRQEGGTTSPFCFLAVGGVTNGPSYSKRFLSDGWLTGVNITQNSIGSLGNQFGEGYVQLFLVRGTTQVPNLAPRSLIACNLSANYSLSWPFNVCGNPVMLPGALISVGSPIANPAAGANFSTNLPATQRFFPQSIRFQLATSAQAALRQVCLKFTYNTTGDVIFVKCIQGTQTVSQTNQYDFCVGCAPSFTGAATLTAIPNNDEVAETLPTPFFFAAGTVTVASVVLNIQTSDQLSLIVVYGEAKHETD